MPARSSRAILEELLKTHNRLIEQAFLESIADIVNRAQIARITESLERGNIEQALDAIGLTDEAFGQVAEAVRAAYLDGGRTTAGAIPAVRRAGVLRAVIRFDARNFEAERWLERSSSALITGFGASERETMRDTLRYGLERGRNPRTTALEIAGRVQAGTNRRAGGFIGLNGPQSEYLRTAREELASGDAAALRNYLRRERRDRRYDRTIIKALRDGKPLTQGQIDVIAGRYADRLLKLRADTIARTETLGALAASQHEAFRQAIDSGAVDAAAVTKTWKAAFKNTRDSHGREGLHNAKVGFNGVFASNLGSLMRYPHDTSLGAVAGDIINCQCIAEYKIDFARGVT